MVTLWVRNFDEIDNVQVGQHGSTIKSHGLTLKNGGSTIKHGGLTIKNGVFFTVKQRFETIF